MTVKRETVRARAILLAPIRLYQRFVSPALPRRCKYYPTCSEYAVDAIRELGVVRGLVVAGWRLLRCNPFSHGGYDPIQNRSLFRTAGSSGHSQTRSNRTREHTNLIPAETARRRTRERARVPTEGGKFASELAGGRGRARAEAEYVAR